MADGFAGSPVLLSYTVAHILATVLSLAVAAYTVRNHWHKSLGRAFTGLLVSAAIWTTGSLARVFTGTPDAFIAASTFKYVGIVTAPVLFVLFALLYDGKTQWVTRRVVASLLVVPAVTVPIVGTTQLHGLFYRGILTTAVDDVAVLAVQTVGPWYWLYVVYGWGLVAIGSWLLIRSGLKRPRLYRIQLLVLLPAVGVSWVTNTVYAGWSWPHPALDPTPIGFAVTCLLLGFGLFSTQLVEVSPAARSLVFEVIDDPVIVVDSDDRVVDVNDAAQPLLADTDPVGGELATILVADVAQQIASGVETVELDEEPTTRHYQYRELSIESGGERVLVFTDVTERKERERELELLNAMLRHDVRNDLQLVTAYADLLAEECEDDDVTEYITTIQESADHAVELTETAREIANVMLSDTPQRQRVDLRNVLEDEVSNVQSSYPDAAVTYGTTIPSVAIDTTGMISSVFRNLLKNAIQHNDKAVAAVTVSATAHDDVVTVRIADNGPGVPDAQKGTLFGEGENGPGGTGSGMGLYLVDTLVNGYGGEVWVEDNDPEGSIFVVELPRAN